jgi:hypothetical protein
MFICKPEFIYLMAVCIFVAIILVLQNGVDENNIPTEGFVVYGVTYSFVTYGVASIFITIIVLTYLFTIRIYERHLNKVKSLKKFHILKYTVSEYYVFLTLTYVFLVALGIVWLSFTGEYVLFYSCIFLPLIYETYLIFFFNWKLNDFAILGDVSKFNKKIEEYKKIKKQQAEERVNLKNIYIYI